jgi:DHA2 family multidrug resistance protein
MTSFLAARFGRRNYYVGSILLFTAASAACGQAHTIWELVAFRFIQGIGGCALLSTSQAILFETFTLEQRGFASAIFGVGVFIGPTIGPTLGGWIIDNHSWPWIFYINLPIGITAALLSWAFVREPKHVRSSEHIDWAGIGLLVAGLGALQTVLERGQHEDWFSSRYISVLAIVATVSLIAFVVRELMVEHPVVDLHVLRSPPLASAAALTFVMGFTLFGSVFIVPIFVQRLLGYTAIKTGMLFLPGAGVSIIFLPIVGKMLVKGVPPQYLIIFGFSIVAVFSFMLSHLDLGAGSGDFFWPIILRAVGLCFAGIPLTQLAVSGLPQRDMPQGVALNNMMRQVGGSFGIAFINTYLDHRTAAHRSDLVSSLSAGDPATQARLHFFTQGMLAHGATRWEAPHQAFALLDSVVQRQASLLAYLDGYRLIALIVIISLPLMVIAGRPRGVHRISAAAAAAESH